MHRLSLPVLLLGLAFAAGPATAQDASDVTWEQIPPPPNYGQAPQLRVNAIAFLAGDTLIAYTNS